MIQDTGCDSMQERIFQMLFDQDEITWQSIIYELIKTEQMNPWDINISLLTQRFLEKLKALKEMDFRISGKVLLAAAILLKIKSDKLVTDDISDFDRLMHATDMSEEKFYDELASEINADSPLSSDGSFKLTPRTPQPRKRKVSVYDLVDALNKALEVKNRRLSRRIPEAPVVEAPKKQQEITVIIKRVYAQIVDFVVKQNYERVKFSQLLPSEDKEAKVFTFVPLLHLTNQRKVDLEQKEHFSDFDILLLNKKKVIA